MNSFCEYNFFGLFLSSIRSDMFYKVGLLKNFKKFTGKDLCRSLFFLMKSHNIKSVLLFQVYRYLLDNNLLSYYSKRIPENLSELFNYFMVASKIILFLFSSKRESPHNRISRLLLSVMDSKLIVTDFTLFIRSMRWLEK